MLAIKVLVLQEFVNTKIAELINTHILWDAGGTAGQVIVELGRAETYIHKCCHGDEQKEKMRLPSDKGSVVHQLLTHPDQVKLENFTMEQFQVSNTIISYIINDFLSLFLCTVHWYPHTPYLEEP